MASVRSQDDPVLGVLGGDDERPVRIVDRRHMRHLRCFGDVAIGAQTLREQPRLLQTPQEPDDPPAPALYAFRRAHGLPAQPRHVVYSLGGCLDVALPVFNTPGVEAIVVTTEKGAADLRACGAPARGVDLILDALEDADGLHRAHARLFAERGVRYLDCEGGQTVLAALHRAHLLDEVFVTETDVTVDVSRHAGVLRNLRLRAGRRRADRARRGPGGPGLAVSPLAIQSPLTDAGDSYSVRAWSFSSSPVVAPALSPEPVSTSTVSSCGRMTPAVSSRLRPAAATAEVGST